MAQASGGVHGHQEPFGSLLMRPVLVPFSDMEKNARLLHPKDCLSQCKAAVRILKIWYLNIHESAPRSRFKPEALMWEGYEAMLAGYAMRLHDLCLRRGQKPGTLPREVLYWNSTKLIAPRWFGLDELHRRHRSMLCRMSGEYYKRKIGNHDPEPMAWPRVASERWSYVYLSVGGDPPDWYPIREMTIVSLATKPLGVTFDYKKPYIEGQVELWADRVDDILLFM